MIFLHLVRSYTLNVTGDMTCGWLLQHIQQHASKFSPDQIVSLSSCLDKHECLDHYLTLTERTLHSFEHSTKIKPIYNNEIRILNQLNKNGKMGKYEAIKVIGKGGFSTVLQVRQKSTGKLFAMKIMSKQRV